TKEKARVVSVDNANIFSVGLLKQGDQKLEVEILTGAHKGEIFKAGNVLRANMELDKIFAPGDTILAAIPSNANPSTDTINAQDHYRAGWTLFLCGLFALLLVAFAYIPDLRRFFQWRLLRGRMEDSGPDVSEGSDPIPVCLACVCILSAAIIFLVA
ncbi:MAG: YibE/F family protein, partial [Bacilli bacterium]